jgi:hypothetical protein
VHSSIHEVKVDLTAKPRRHTGNCPRAPAIAEKGRSQPVDATPSEVKVVIMKHGMECPAQFVPVEMRQTGTRGAGDGARKFANSIEYGIRPQHI